MGRLFSLLAVIAVLMVFVAGGSIYWLSAAMVAQAREDEAAAVAKAVASSLSEQIDLFSRALDKMALDPEVVNAVTGVDPVLLAAVAANLEKHFPDALKIRLLLPGSGELDEQSVPRMGFADLDMVRETFTANQLPAIQGGKGPDRHLAMTSRIMQHDKAVGVILASLNYDFIGKSLQAAAIKDGYIELMQEKSVLGVSGDKNDTGQREIAQAPVTNTDWKINYHYNTGSGLGKSTLIVIFIIVPGLISILAFFVVHRKLSNLLTQDLGSIIKAVKDMMTHKAPGSYPVNLSEMNAVISTLVQFKRFLDRCEDFKLDATLVSEDDFELDYFLLGADLDFKEHFSKKDHNSELPADIENAFKKNRQKLKKPSGRK
ncbi:MAG: hypothetical protein PHD43_19270 [Methylococcales bacterium]|nr:hypothetical protein [Methylococcales bacterium]